MASRSISVTRPNSASPTADATTIAAHASAKLEQRRLLRDVDPERLAWPAEVLGDHRGDDRERGGHLEPVEQVRQRVGQAGLEHHLAWPRTTAAARAVSRLDTDQTPVTLINGKKTMTATTQIFDSGSVMPNHWLAMGARATMGVELIAAANGSTASRGEREA